MRIKETVATLVAKIENEDFVFDYLLKKEILTHLELSFSRYYDIGSKHLEQIYNHLHKRLVITPAKSTFSITSVERFLKSLFKKDKKKLPVITRNAFENYDKFYIFIAEAINASDLDKDLHMKPAILNLTNTK